MYLVVFRNRKTAAMDAEQYYADAQEMVRLAQSQPGFIAFKDYAAEDGEIVALSEWESEAAALAWRRNTAHMLVQARGCDEYYESYTLFACDEPRVHHFTRKDQV